MSRARTLLISDSTLLSASVPSYRRAETPFETFATRLNAPSKIIQTPRGNFIVAEGVMQVPSMDGSPSWISTALGEPGSGDTLKTNHRT